MTCWGVCLPRRRGWCCRLCKGAAILLLLLFFYLKHEWDEASSCSDESSMQTIYNVCKRYRSNVIDGNLCRELCDTHTLRYTHCKNYHGGKLVLFARWHGNIPVVLKTKKAELTEYDLPGYKDASGQLVLPSEDNFFQIVEDSIKFNLGIQPEHSGSELLSMLWSLDYNEFISKADAVQQQRKAFWSIWSLIQQDEYLLVQTLQNQNIHLPTIYGTCGHMYAMENVPPGSLLDPDIPTMIGLRTAPWDKRAKVSLKLLNLIQRFNYGMHEPLHMCDMKGENFGLSDGGTLKAIDVDMAMFASKLKATLVASKCTKHSDCDFFDCRGWCDLAKGSCTEIRINNNLQALCSKVFGSHDGSWGLLSSAPGTIHAQLKYVITQCARPALDGATLPGCFTDASGKVTCPNPAKEDLQFSASDTLQVSLQTLLLKSLETS